MFQRTVSTEACVKSTQKDATIFTMYIPRAICSAFGAAITPGKAVKRYLFNLNAQDKRANRVKLRVAVRFEGIRFMDSRKT